MTSPASQAMNIQRDLRNAGARPTQGISASEGGTASNNTQVIVEAGGTATLSMTTQPPAVLSPKLLLTDAQGRPATKLQPDAECTVLIFWSDGATPALPVKTPMALSVSFYNRETNKQLDVMDPPWEQGITPDQVRSDELKTVEHTFRLVDPLPACQASLRLSIIERTSDSGKAYTVEEVVVELSGLELEGTYLDTQQPEFQEIQVSIDGALPEDGAIMYVRESRPGFVDFSCFSPRGRFPITDQPFAMGPAAIAEEELKDFIVLAREFSTGRPKELIKWLNGLVQRYGSRLGLVICDHKGAGVPWEALDLDGEHFLGAAGGVVRWAPISQAGGDARTLRIGPDQRGGKVLALGPPPGAAFAPWSVDSVTTYEELWGALFAHPESYALVYIGGLDMAARDDERLEKALLRRRRTVISGARPLMLLNASGAGRLSYEQHSVRGLAATLLGQVADGLFGLAGGSPAAAEQLVGDLLSRLTPTTCMVAALQQVREAAFKRWCDDELNDGVELATALLLHYYGNPLMRLLLTPAGQPEGGGQ